MAKTTQFPSDINPAQIMQDMSDKIRLLESKNAEYKRLNEQKAQAEYTFNVAATERILQLRGRGEPATIINTTVKGDKNIAQLKYNYDLACGIVKACEKSMRILESAIDVDRSKLSWLKAEMTNQ